MGEPIDRIPPICTVPRTPAVRDQSPLRQFYSGRVPRFKSTFPFQGFLRYNLSNRPGVCGFRWGARVLEMNTFPGLGMVWGKSNELRPQARSRDGGLPWYPRGKIT